jgi:hypothetical protein
MVGVLGIVGVVLGDASVDEVVGGGGDTGLAGKELLMLNARRLGTPSW